MKLDTKAFEDKMKKTIAVLEEEFACIRIGRASARVLDKITVPYYGTPTAVDGVATVKAIDARTLAITPWETNMLKELEKAIQASDIGITPQNDGKCLRLVFPALTEERRKELTKQTAKMGEEAKVAVRNIRREANDKAKEMKKNSEMTEDEQKASEKIVQDLADRYVKEVDAAVEKKNKEIMEL
ncbi:MAG: ribosome recycling factor [Clostridiales bacterium]|nr:MAG: ribosome recycling factor [Clostridiales bacterium]